MIPPCEYPVNQNAVWLRIFHVFYSHLLYNSRKPRYSLIYYSASAALLSGGAHGYPPAALFSGPVRRDELYPRRPAAVFVAPGTAAEPAPTAFRKLRRLMEYLDAMVKSPFIIRPVERVPGCFATKPIKLVCYYTFRFRRV